MDRRPSGSPTSPTTRLPQPSRRGFLLGVLAAGGLAGLGVARAGAARASAPAPSGPPGTPGAAATGPGAAPAGPTTRPTGTTSTAPATLLRDGSFEGGGKPLDSNAEWAVQLVGGPTGGTFTLTVTLEDEAPKTTAPIPYDAGAEQVATALRALTVLAEIKIDVIAHAELLVIHFDEHDPLPVLTADGSGLTGGTNPGVRVDKLSTWAPNTKSIKTVDHGTHGTQSVRIAAPDRKLNAWRGPFVLCNPGDVLSIGADTRVGRGNAVWTLGLRFFDRSFVELSGTEFTAATSGGNAWARTTATAPAAPTGAVWAAFTVRREGGRRAARRDRLELDAVLVTAGPYAGPMLPPAIMVGDVAPDGFLFSAYAGRGCDLLQARIYQGGTEVPGRSPTPAGTVAPYGWAFTRATGLDPATDYQFRLEARNAKTQAWESFGGDLVPIRTAPPPGAPATFSVALMGCTHAHQDRLTWDDVLGHVVPHTGRKIDYVNWGGDWHYANKITDEEAFHRELFERTWYLVDGLRDVLSRTPLIADQLSDHDGGEGGNNQDSWQSSSVAACQRAMAQMVPTPPLQVPDCRFSTKLVGRVLFVSLDTRSVYRSPMRRLDDANKTLLGEPQRTALFAALDLADANGYVAVIQSDMVWDGAFVPGKKDLWATYSYERSLIVTKITGRRVVMCDYDFHALRIKYVSEHGGVPVIGSAGAIANSNLRGDVADYYDELWPRPEDGSRASTRHWHRLVVVDDGASIRLEVTGFDPREESPVTEAVFTFASDAPR